MRVVKWGDAAPSGLFFGPAHRVWPLRICSRNTHQELGLLAPRDKTAIGRWTKPMRQPQSPWKCGPGNRTVQGN